MLHFSVVTEWLSPFGAQPLFSTRKVLEKTFPTKETHEQVTKIISFVKWCMVLVTLLVSAKRSARTTMASNAR
jgi:K+ transporter